MSELYALQGTYDSGKTEKLKNIYQILIEKYPSIIVSMKKGNVDLKIVLKNVNGMTIGIETQGDPNSRLEHSLNYFKNLKCDIIFCACRTRGMTVDWINSISNIYNVHFISQTVDRKNYKISNQKMANTIIALAGL